MRAKEFLNESLENFADQVKSSLGLKQFALIDKGDDIILSSLMIGKGNQGEGLGTKAMQSLIDYADQNNKRIILTPGTKSAIDGTTSRNRLVKFYKRFGFKESKGRNIDFVLGAGKMYREPNIKEYKVDNERGLGSVPYNQEIDYMGFTVLMKPSTFLKLALPLSKPSSVDYIEKYLKDGGALGSPFLKVELPDEYKEGDFTQMAKVVGHEGRNRMLAIQKVDGDDDPVEVQIFTRGDRQEFRARHLTPEIINHLNKGIRNESDTQVVTGPLFQTML